MATELIACVVFGALLDTDCLSKKRQDNTPSKILFQQPSPTIVKKTSSAILFDLLVNNSRYTRVLNIDAEKCLGKAQITNQGKLAWHV